MHFADMVNVEIILKHNIRMLGTGICLHYEISVLDLISGDTTRYVLITALRLN